MPYSSTNVVLYPPKNGRMFKKDQRFAFDLPFDNANALFDTARALRFISCSPIKLEPEIDVKLEIDSAAALPGNVSNYKYAIIEMEGNERSVMVPFFIDRIDRVSDQVVRVRLSIDELNFLQALGAADGLVSFLTDRTRVIREHKDRFAISKTGNSYIPIIDRFPEGISGDFQRTSKESIELPEPFEPNGGKGFDWTEFFFSDGTDATSPISTFLVPSKELFLVTNKANSKEMEFSLIPANVSLYFALPEAIDLNVDGYLATGASPARSVKLGEEATIDGRPCVVMAARIWTGTKDTGGGRMLRYAFYKEWYDKNGIFVKEEIVSQVSDGLVRIVAPQCARVFSGTGSTPTSIRAILGVPEFVSFFSKDVNVAERVSAEKEIDRTALGLKKAICLPYRPFDYATDGSLPSGCFIVGGKILLTRNNFESTIEFTPSRKITLALPKLSEKPIETADGKARALQLEPKVYSSEFRFTKLVYDSFSIALKGEDSYFNSNLSEIGNEKIVFKFFASPSIVSEFDFSLYSWPGQSPDERILSTIWAEDYPGHLIINRNNETPVYTSGYLDYLRTGYNYDLKSQAVQIGMQGLGIALSAINAGVGIASTFATGGLSAPYAVSSATGFVSSLANIGKTAAENQRGNAQRLKELQAQGAAVSGNSDFAVSTRYTKNRVSLETYEVEPRMLRAARNFFYLKGYATDEIKAPKAKNRAHFDFLQCDPDFSPAAIAKLPNWVLDMVADDLRQGITIFHQGLGEYDIEQQSSNFELSILNS